MRAILVLVALAGVLGSAQAQRPSEIIRDNARRDLMVSLFVSTKRCMRSAGLAAAQRNDDPLSIQHFMVTVCADPLRVHLQHDRMTEEEARQLLVRMARTSYYEDVLRKPEPPYQPN